jgi:sporulation protein YlmC with PRC-barrel domain
VRSRPRRVYLADLIGSPVIDGEGRRAGHVVDLLVDERYRVTAVLLGPHAWAQRLHVGRLWRGAPRTVPWDRVDRFEDLRLYLKR